MSPRFSATAFSLAYCVAYAAVFALDAPLFLYYPVEGRLAWSWAPFAAALPISLLLPEQRAMAALRNLLWLFPAGALLVSAWLLRVFFQGG